MSGPGVEPANACIASVLTNQRAAVTVAAETQQRQLNLCELFGQQKQRRAGDGGALITSAHAQRV